MAGFTLPKLRWLVLGAAAAGIWAMTQDVPPRGSVAKPEQRQATARSAPEPAARSGATRAIPLSTPQKITPPDPKPSDMITSSIPRPANPVGPTSESRKLFATSRVRLRQNADTTASVVSTLERGQAVTSLSHKGKWHLVSVSGQKGWVHGDFLSDDRPVAKPVEIVEAVRPKVPVARQRDAAAEQSSPSPNIVSTRQTADSGGAWGGLRPVRAPQGGDCQCPYDLMLSGKQCGDRSAYVRRTGQAQCYF